MDLLFIDIMNKRPYLIATLIAVSAITTILINIYGLANGITNILPHLLYIPIILTAYYYPRQGIPAAIGISAIYCITVYFLHDTGPGGLPFAIELAVAFIIVAGVVSYLSGQMHHDAGICRRLVSIVACSNDAIIGKNLDGIITDWNDGAEHLYGYTAPETIGKSITLLSPPEHAGESSRLLEKIRQGGMIERYETERVTKDGKRIQVSLSMSPIKDSNDRIIGASVIAHDITDQKRARKALADSEARYRSIVETTPNLIWETDPGGTFIYVSPQSETLLGYRPEEMMKRSIFNLLPQEKHAELREAMSRHSTEHYTFDVETRHRITNTRINIEIVSQPVHAENGTLTGFQGIAVDITDRKRAQREIAERERFLQRLIETISNPIFYKDRIGIYTGCNSAFEKYIGLPKEQVIGKTAYDISPKDLADIYCAMDKELLDTPGARSYEAQVRYADGTRRDVLFNKATLFDADDHVDGIVGVIVDITDRKQMEDAIRVANEKLNMLASITRHDILNNLTGLMAFIALSKETTQDPELLGFIAKEEEAAEAIEDQIDFTRYYQDIGVHAPAWHDVERTIRASEADLPLREITLDIAVNGLEIFADPLLGKVFYNLIDNSLRHGKHVTTIAFTVENTVRGKVLVYRDNGVGISAKEKARLFFKGFGRHTGLGLFLSREILAITGLSITETGEPGNGVRFEILMPPGTCRFPPPGN